MLKPYFLLGKGISTKDWLAISKKEKRKKTDLPHSLRTKIRIQKIIRRILWLIHKIYIIFLRNIFEFSTLVHCTYVTLLVAYIFSNFTYIFSLIINQRHRIFNKRLTRGWKLCGKTHRSKQHLILVR